MALNVATRTGYVGVFACPSRGMASRMLTEVASSARDLPVVTLRRTRALCVASEPRHSRAHTSGRTSVPDVWPLVLAAGAVSGAAALGVAPVRGGLAHHVALPPLDLLAYVRVLMAEAPSFPWFIAYLVLVLTLRSLMLAAMLGVSDRRGVVRGLGFYGIALGPALIADGLGFAGVAAVYSVFLWLAVAVAILAVVGLGPRPWRPHGRRRGARLAVLIYGCALLGVSLPWAVGGGAMQVGLVWVSAG
jgi:hypothetical protein